MSRKARLAAFYGIGASGSSGNADDIDSPAFDADKHFEDLLKRSSVPRLLETRNSLDQEIRVLDSDMQTLVYANYNKFISATDTIRQMKGKIEHLEDEMHQLRENVSKITSYSETIDRTLVENRGKIQQLESVHTLVHKLQFLIEMPARLNRFERNGHYAEAVKYWSGCSVILTKHGNIASFARIGKECQVVLDRLKGKLRLAMKQEHANERTVLTSVKLLVQLNEPAGTLRRDYLAIQKPILEKKLRDILSKPAHAHGESGSVYTLVTILSTEFFPSFSDFVTNYKDLFLTSPKLPPLQVQAATNDLETFTTDIFTAFFNSLKGHLSQATDTFDLLEGLTLLSRHVDRLTALVGTTLRERCDDVLSKSLHQYVDRAFDTLNGRITEHLNSLRDTIVRRQTAARPAPSADDDDSNDTPAVEVKSPLQEPRVLMTRTADALLQSAQSVLRSLQPFFDSSHVDTPFVQENVTVLTTAIHVNLQQFLLFLAEKIHEFTGGPRVRNAVHSAGPVNSSSVVHPPIASVVLVLSALCLHFVEAPVKLLIDETQKSFKLRDAKVIDQPVILEVYQTTAQRVLAQYVEMQGVAVAQLVRKSIDTRDWLAWKKEAREVRSVVDLVLEELTKMAEEVGGLYVGGDQSPAMAERATARRPGLGDANLQRMFRERVKNFSTPEFRKFSILNAVVNLMLKTFLETVRLTTFNHFGMQQIQLDVRYLTTELMPFVENASATEQLLSDIAASVERRTVDPEPMEASVMQSILEHKRGKRAGAGGAAGRT